MKLSRPILVLTVLLFAAALAAAQGDKRPDTRKNWDRLSQEMKKELRKKFENFKTLPPEEQERFRKRHQELRRLRQKIAGELEDELAELPPEEARAILDRKVRDELRALEDKVKKKKIVDQVPPGDSEKQRKKHLRRELARQNRDLASRHLRELREEGTITEEEARKIESLGHEERVAATLDLRKRKFLDSVEGHLPPDDFNRFKRMPWRPFRDELDRQKREKGLFGGFSKLCELTPDQQAELETIDSRKKRMQAKHRFFEENFRKRFSEMGVADEKIEELLALPMRKRLDGIMRVMQEVPPEKIPPGLHDLLRKPPSPDGLERRGPGPRRSEKDRTGTRRGPGREQRPGGRPNGPPNGPPNRRRPSGDGDRRPIF